MGQGGAHSTQWGPAGGGPSGTPCLISEDLSPYLHSHARSDGERNFPLPLPPLIKNYKCLIKS